MVFLPPSPQAPLPPLPVLRARAQVVAEIRAFFAAQGFVEVDTPVAIVAPAAEAAIDAVAVDFAAAPPHMVAHRRFLQTSPELGMKRLVAHGLGDIFQLAAVFRDADASPIHRPEFRLLEWYRAHAAWPTLLTDCEALLGQLVALCRKLWASLGQGPTPAHLDLLEPPYPRIAVAEAFARHAQIDLARCSERDALAAALVARGVHHAASDTWADLFHRVFVGLVEPKLLADRRPFFLTHFPAPLASLAQLDPNDAQVAERFELYAGGVELANGFGELRCAATQRQRFADELHARQNAGKRTYPVDEAYLEALDRLPPTAGIALGLERLLLVLFDAPNIDAVSFLPWFLPCSLPWSSS